MVPSRTRIQDFVSGGGLFYQMGDYKKKLLKHMKNLFKCIFIRFPRIKERFGWGSQSLKPLETALGTII